MKKFIVAFGMGMAMTYLVLLVGLRLTYTQNIPAFVFAVDAVIMVALIIGSVGTLLETARETRDEDEVAPLPEEIKVTNDRVEKAPEKGPTTDSNADHSREGKKIRIAFEGQPSSLMEETLREATK